MRQESGGWKVQREIAEAALGHVVPGVEGDYRRRDALALRRDWRPGRQRPGRRRPPVRAIRCGLTAADDRAYNSQIWRISPYTWSHVLSRCRYQRKLWRIPIKAIIPMFSRRRFLDITRSVTAASILTALRPVRVAEAAEWRVCLWSLTCGIQVDVRLK